MAKKVNKTVSRRSKIRARTIAKTIIANDGNKSAAARELGVTPAAISFQVRENPLVQAALNKFIEKIEAAGATEEEAGRVLAESMKAKTVVTATFQGEISDEKAYADYPTRLHAVEIYLKIKRLTSDKTVESNTQLNIYNFKDAKTEDLLRSLQSELQAIQRAEHQGQDNPNKPV